MADFTAKQKALAIIPKFSGALSMIGSAFIFQHIIRSPKRRGLVYHRLLLMMSLSDFIGSSMFFLSTWPIPKGTPGVYGAMGTTETCTAAGFFNHGSALTTPMYNASLAIYYVLVIRYGFKEAQVKQVEPLFHAIPLAAGWGTAIASLPMKLFNSANWLCWIAPHPPGCLDSHTYGETTCERGDNAWIYRWAFLYAEVWTIFIFISIAMFMVYLKVLSTERAVDKYRRGANSKEESRKQSRKVANQAMLYVGAFYMTWIFGTVTRLVQLTQDGKIYFPIIIMMTIFFPLQGFFNCIVYLRPRYMRYTQKHPDQGIGQVVARGFNDLRQGMSVLRATTKDGSRTTRTTESSGRDSEAKTPEEIVAKEFDSKELAGASYLANDEEEFRSQRVPLPVVQEESVLAEPYFDEGESRGRRVSQLEELVSIVEM